VNPIKKAILKKLIHPAILMLLEQRENDPRAKEKLNIPGEEWAQITWLERILLSRINKKNKKRIEKEDAQKVYNRIMAQIINPDLTEDPNVQAQQEKDSIKELKEVWKQLKQQKYHP